MKKFFNKIVLFLKNLFTNLDEWIHDFVQPSIETVQRLKKLLDSPGANLVTALIPGDADDKLKAFALEYLSKAITLMNLTNEMALEPDWTSKVSKLLEYLKLQSPETRKAIYFRLASIIAKEASGVKEQVKGHRVDLLVAMQVAKYLENASADQLGNETIVNGELVQTQP